MLCFRVGGASQGLGSVIQECLLQVEKLPLDGRLDAEAVMPTRPLHTSSAALRQCAPVARQTFVIPGLLSSRYI